VKVVLILGTMEVSSRAQLNERSTGVDFVCIVRKPDVYVCLRIIDQICIIDSDLTGEG